MTTQRGIRGISTLTSPFFLPLSSLWGFPVVYLKWKPEDKKPVAVAHSGKQLQDRERGESVESHSKRAEGN